MSGGKLQSLQGLRGISIILVIIFHLFPKYFVNGFVGVDMFFVLSGYLMTMILSKEFTVSSINNFYKKRFCRIVPLYYITIFATTIAVLCLVLKSERKDFLYDLSWCLPLVSNFQPIFEHHSYWDQVSTIRYLTHLWSLCTELQYYLMAPIIHLIASNLPFSSRIFGYTIAIIILFFFQLLTPFELSYCFLASRVWQFLLGSVAFNLSEKNDIVMDFYSEKKKNDKKLSVFDGFPYVFVAILASVIALPWIFGEHLTRLTMSLTAAVLCLLCGRLEQSFFTFSPLVFIGNISYVTYLIHWPVINIVKYIQQKDESNLNITEAVIAVIIIFILSLLVHYALERKLLQFNFIVNFTITAFIVGACLAMYPWLENKECLAMNTLSSSTIEKIDYNFNSSEILIEVSELGCEFNETTANLAINLAGIEYCSHKGNGTGIIMVIGNSLAVRAYAPIFKLFNGQYEEIRLFAKHGGAPLLDFFPYYNEAVLDMAREIKPDLLWIIQGVNEILFHDDDSTYNFDPDNLDEVLSVTIEKFKSVTDRIYIDLPYFITKKLPAKLIARSLVYRKNLDENLSISQKELESQLDEQTERLMNLNCSICHFNDVQKALNHGQEAFYMYEKDSYRALNYDGSHLTSTGYKYIQPLYRDRIDQFYKYLNSQNMTLN